MLKSILELWPPTRLTSDNGGSMVVYNHDPAHIDRLGQAKAVRLEVVTLTRSSSTARLTVAAFENARRHTRPSALRGGTAITLSGSQITTLTTTIFDLVGPTLGRVEVTLGVDSNGGAQFEWVEVTANATLIYA